MKDGISILFLILFGLLWPSWLQRKTRGVTMWACFAAPFVAFFFGRMV